MQVTAGECIAEAEDAQFFEAAVVFYNQLSGKRRAQATIEIQTIVFNATHNANVALNFDRSATGGECWGSLSEDKRFFEERIMPDLTKLPRLQKAEVKVHILQALCPHSSPHTA